MIEHSILKYTSVTLMFFMQPNQNVNCSYVFIFETVPSQVIVSRTLSKKQMMMSVATKVAIQLNCKLGGEVWAVDIPVSIASMSYFCL